MGWDSSVAYNSRITAPDVLLIPTSYQLSDCPYIHDVCLYRLSSSMHLLLQGIYLMFLSASEPSDLRHCPLAGGRHFTNKLCR